MNRRTALRNALAAGLAAIAGTACGQKGPLFLPEEKLEEMERKRDQRKSGKSTGSAPTPGTA